MSILRVVSGGRLLVVSVLTVGLGLSGPMNAAPVSGTHKLQAIEQQKSLVIGKPKSQKAQKTIPARKRSSSSRPPSTARPTSTVKPVTSTLLPGRVLLPPPISGTRFEVTSRTLTFEDMTRPTSRTSASAATTTRKLPTLVVSPKVTNKKFPLFVFSHGLGGEPVLYQSLLEAIAARGYVVAAPTFPLSNRKSPGGPSLFDQPNQPADVSFVITQMLTDSAVNPDLVVVGGHSLGAITTVDVVANSCCFDKRVDAAVMVAGTANVFTSGKLFESPAVPTLFLHGEKDATVGYSLGYSTWKALIAPKWFLTVVGGDHSFGIAGQPALLAQTGALMVDAMIRFVDSRVKGANGGDSTKALKVAVDANPSVFRLESVAK